MGEQTKQKLKHTYWKIFFVSCSRKTLVFLGCH